MEVGQTDGNQKYRETCGAVPLKRVVALRQPITRRNAAYTINRLLYLEAGGDRSPILMEVQSSGGPMEDASGIIRVMERSSCPVATFCDGEVHGTAVVIAASGARGFRVAHPECRFSLPTGLAQPEIDGLMAALTAKLGKDHANGSAELLEWSRTGAEFNAEQALKLGVIDAISPKPRVPAS